MAAGAPDTISEALHSPASDAFAQGEVGGTDHSYRRVSCPDGLCDVSGVLSEMASDFMDAGGWTRDLIRALFDHLGREFCANGPCEDSGKLTLCHFESAQVYRAVYDIETKDGGLEVGQGWVYEFACCCTIMKDIPLGTPRTGWTGGHAGVGGE